ncbi:Hypothetical protein AJAP_07495 [Amycolatopsis japonica]|uniref:Uncharacterized protein n=1 Tax=Amycolatopsis japonica TaxID=208439 RepID=A0A075UPT3_9PSEU|nr:hypothetical protein [Amycolatopsis japonica]AIG74411.1 Hypothetical protein AJAP_07495 [Amycolatopsis japonica]
MTVDDTFSTSPRNGRDEHEWLPLDTARDAFSWLVTGPDPMAVHGSKFAGLPRRPVPLDELRDRLLSKQCPSRTRDAVWAHLVLSSRAQGGAWTVACVGMALPSLASSAGWLAARYRGDRADAHAAVLAGFIEALATVDLTDPGIFLRLHFAARRAGQAALEESLDAPRPVGMAFRSTVPKPPYGHPDLVLATAVGEQILTPAEAELISATRLGETSMTAWAQRHDTALATAYKARNRAEDRLVSWLRQQTDGTGDEDPVADAALSALRAAAPAAATDDDTHKSRAVSGRLRNGRPANRKKASRSVSKNNPKSGLLGCGESPTNSPRTAENEPTSEVRRCA